MPDPLPRGATPAPLSPGASSSQPPDLVKPFGKYVLVRKLAEGGMAEIFLAKQIGAEGFERNVVIKRMLQHLTAVPDFVGMFLDEARLAARLSHQNVVQINDLGLADGCYYICMEYLAGEDFSTVLRTAGRRREYVPISVVCRVVIDAAHGLHFAHDFADESGKAMGVVHRDISPSNIYVTYSGQVKVLDFGIAKAESRVTHTTAGVVKGKYMYMAPEQARGATVDRRADVFSLGVSLYEALTNVRPFSRDNDLAILNAVLRCEFKPPRQLRPDLPIELEQIVLKSMAGKLEDRYQSCAAFAADLEKFLASATSASGGAQVSAYVKNLFGEERVTQKTRIPTLQSLAPAGLALPGFNPDAKTQAGAAPLITPSGGVAALPGQRTSGPMAQVEPGTQMATAKELAKARRSNLAVVIGAVAIGAVAAFGGMFAFLKYAFNPNQQQAAVTQAAQTQQIATGPSGSNGSGDVKPPDSNGSTGSSTVPANGTGNTANTVAASGTQAATTTTANATDADQNAKDGSGPDEDTAEGPGKPKTAPKHVKPVQLDAPTIQKVVSKGSGTIMKCFESFKEDLPADQGRVSVKFTILGSGKVSDTEVVGALNGTKVGGCLAKNVSRLKFPVNTDREITLTQTFQYTVQR